ncbi:class I adenylate-forming enzyme family protein [Asticcacaulis sp. BYS171W]|uniref:Long-chain-fatty-acid--CoA ligase n=1 Tax=Asticcacaulis aquaticus TaxID=2984212 RepID=A0ABT5HRR1_9CAUL|nr:class I adenylate-forming enzyme family protein [Asticcacaulis aquaticus]MDC7682753.1 class I adenylate-forming enzyme family protein [Asticcacaulis aquaticus]
MNLSLDTRFELIEGGQVFTAADLRTRAENVSTVVTVTGDHPVADLIAALIAISENGTDLFVQRNSDAEILVPDQSPGRVWLQTSGTTGTPKWAGHDLSKLTQKIAAGSGAKARWLLTYHPFSFAGVQVVLSAMIGGHTLIAPPLKASVSDMAGLAEATQPTHISGTPTFWRAFLMAAPNLDLKSVTLGGEATDQGLLDALRARFPNAHIRHIYATTEAGVVFTVSDGKAGFPATWLNDQLAITEHGTLSVNGRDTHDAVTIDGDRVLFRGRLDSMVNIGGVKVFPEEVEAYLLTCTAVRDVRVTARPNPITGHILTAEIALDPSADETGAKAQIKAHIQTLPRAQRPVSLSFVEAIPYGETGKKSRAAS